MLEPEARAAAFDEPGLDRHLVAIPRRQEEAGVRRHQRMAGEAIGAQIFELAHAERALDQNGGRDIEDLEVARIEDDPGRVAVTPLDAGVAGAGEHADGG